MDVVFYRKNGTEKFCLFTNSRTGKRLQSPPGLIDRRLIIIPRKRLASSEAPSLFQA